MSEQGPSIVIIGGGTGGLTTAALLTKKLKKKTNTAQITLIDPAKYHYYQPAWTLVGGGAYVAEKTQKTLQSLVPKGVKHLVKKVESIQPEKNQLTLSEGEKISYDYLIVAAGIQINWGAIQGLEAALGKNGVSSNYRYDLAPYTWELTRQFQGGKAIFTQPAGAVKCPGAPQKALYLAADYFKKQGIQADLAFHSGAASIFGVPFYAKALDVILKNYGAQAVYQSQLVEVKGPEKIAVFETQINGVATREEIAYDFLHVVPPQSAPDFIKSSLLANDEGWLQVDQHTLKHVKYHNVYGLGDCTTTPNSKTAAAIKSQAPVLVANLIEAIEKKSESHVYDGYAGCPITTEQGKVLLAEFTYGGVITPSFSADPRVPRKFYWWLKRSFIPFFYWHGLLKGKNIKPRHKERLYAEKLPAKIEAAKVN